VIGDEAAQIRGDPVGGPDRARTGPPPTALFVDQRVLQGDGTHTSGARQLEVSAVHGDGSWRIDGITVL
jgi:hypothetical protein